MWQERPEIDQHELGAQLSIMQKPFPTPEISALTPLSLNHFQRLQQKKNSFKSMIKMEVNYQGHWDRHMLVDYC